ncbi:MAG: hybrid sensor histidine kinase/response regulator [Cytophagales bacterium]|nr:MAG: hybrid sensor histidine kinase/response regulator [Cytophagales bacterium]TAF59750.1 MAG: hybrid sensor histidine kinase/response regulator [Cytophagales bacterium]
MEDFTVSTDRTASDFMLFKILIVDDVPSNLFTLKALLEERFPAEIIEAGSGFEALEVLMRESIDLIILDIQMPEMDGFQTAKLIRSRKKTKNIPIVFLTAAYKSEDFKNKGFALGATDYLTKPIDDYQLTNRINAYLSIIKLEKTHKMELERKVEERTRELKETMFQLQDANEKLESTLKKLKNAQRQVIAQEKLASLGELTAGIAHEIKNPLNFVINFSELSKDLLQEMQDLADNKMSEVPTRTKDDLSDIMLNLKENADKIHEHGKRADSIINNMLLHSHDKKGVYQDTHINTMLQEYTSLAYHSAVNTIKGFAATVDLDLDESIDRIKIIPQDIGRVFLNMLNNAFYSLHKKKLKLGDDYQPRLLVKTINLGDKIEILFRDNGLGIPEKIIYKIFNPFFTTKPAGEGTGLGLSICYDIVKNIHKGDVLVDSQIGEFAEFSVYLPFNQA